MRWWTGAEDVLENSVRAGLAKRSRWRINKLQKALPGAALKADHG